MLVLCSCLPLTIILVYMHSSAFMKKGSDCLWAIIQSSNIVSTCWNKPRWCLPFTPCLNSTGKSNLCISPVEILFVLLSKYSNEKTRGGKPSLCLRIGQFVKPFPNC